MHLIVPYAAALAEGGRAAARQLALPRLAALLGRLGPAGPEALDRGDEWSFSPPHERALARALGFAGGDGGLPWAAWHARADGIDPGDLAWGELTPVHWHLGTEQVSLMDPAALVLDEAASRACLEAVRELFVSEGFVVEWGAPLRWYVAHESLGGLRTASLDRVIGRNVDRWLTDQSAVRLVRRLQNEVQMLMYTHPLNAAREAQGRLPVNSFWLSGCGVAQKPQGPTPTVDSRLRESALAEDWAAWAKAWETLDEGPLDDLAQRAARGEAVCLTLCGERSALTLEPVHGFVARAKLALAKPTPASILETL